MHLFRSAGLIRESTVGLILLNYLWGENGVIAAQPVVEVILAVLCLGMYGKDKITARVYVRG